MPALDSLVGGGAIHVADQNKASPVKTLCGQALDKDTTRYFMHRDNFEQATCKVCRGIYFDEGWTGEVRQDPRQEARQTVQVNEPEPEQQVVRPLFGNLQRPVNAHQNQGSNQEEKTDGP